MAILVGIIESEISYSNCYGSQNDTIRNLIIIKEGSTSDLIVYSKQKRQDVIDGRLEFDVLIKTHNQCLVEGRKALKEYSEKAEIIRQKIDFEKYKDIMILEGMIV